MLGASLSLSVGMVLARNAWRLSLSPGELPTDISPFQTNVVSSLTFVVLITIDYKTPFGIVTSGSYEGKKKCIIYKPWSTQGMPGNTQQVCGKRELALPWGFCFSFGLKVRV